MGRSYALPSFFISAGARFITILFEGIINPLFLMAERTLSFFHLTTLEIYCKGTVTVRPYPASPDGAGGRLFGAGG